MSSLKTIAPIIGTCSSSVPGISGHLHLFDEGQQLSTRGYLAGPLCT